MKAIRREIAKKAAAIFICVMMPALCPATGSFAASGKEKSTTADWSTYCDGPSTIAHSASKCSRCPISIIRANSANCDCCWKVCCKRLET